MADIFLFRRKTAAEWTSANPVLLSGELGLETDTGLFKFGNGSSTWTARPYAGASVGVVPWGAITGTLSAQTDLQAALNAKQATLVSGTNIKTINGNSLLGAGDLSISGGGSAAWGSITGTLSAQTDLQTALNAKAPIASPTFTGTVTLPAGQVVNGVTLTTGGGTTNFLRADGTYAAPPGGGGATNLAWDAATSTVTSDTGTDATLTVADGTNPGLMTSANFTKLAAITGTNTGDQTTIVGITGTKAQFDTAVTDGNFLYVGDVTSNATHTGDATGATALTLATVNSNVGSFGSATQVMTQTVNAKGLTTAAANVSIAIPASQVTDFSEAVDDRVAALVVAGTNMTITYNDGAGTLTFDAAGGGGGVTDGDKGDITVSGSGSVWTVDPLAINTQSGTTYTLVLTDAKATVEMTNASTKTLTIPLNSAVAFPTGSVITIRNLSATAITVSFASGISVSGSTGTVAGPASFSIPAWQTCTLQDTGTDTWAAVVTGAASTGAFDYGLSIAIGAKLFLN